jgi:SNF2 family DNA or RNA helicase
LKGCGKTVQVIALLTALFNKTGTGKDLQQIRDRNKEVQKHLVSLRKLRDEALYQGGIVDDDDAEWRKTLGLSPWHPVLIIVPPTILESWKSKGFEVFSHFSVATYSSTRKTEVLDAVRYGAVDILLCPKSQFQSDEHARVLNQINWKLVVIDEFHNYKNVKGKLSNHLRELKRTHNPLILGMTGTLMQNNHKELWNLIDLVETNYLHEYELFKENYEKPILMARQKVADPAAIARSEAASSEIRKKLAKIKIERKKKDVLGDQLTAKTERVIFCSLTKLQKEVYRLLIELPDFDNVKRGGCPCDCGVNQSFFRKFKRLTEKSEQIGKFHLKIDLYNVHFQSHHQCYDY